MCTILKKRPRSKQWLSFKTGLLILTISFLNTSILTTYVNASPPTESLLMMVGEAKTSSQSKQQMNVALSPGLNQEFSKQQTLSRWWWWGWMSGLSTLGVGALSLALQEFGDTPDYLATKEGYYMSLGLIGLGLLSTGIQRPKSMNALDELDAMPRRTPEERAQVNARALELKQQDKKQAQRGNSWLAHTLTVTVASIAGTTLWLRHEDPWLGLRSFASAILVTELRMWMRPEFPENDEHEHQVTASQILKSLTLFPYSLEEGEHQGFALGGRF